MFQIAVDFLAKSAQRPDAPPICRWLQPEGRRTRVPFRWIRFLIVICALAGPRYLSVVNAEETPAPPAAPPAASAEAPQPEAAEPPPKPEANDVAPAEAPATEKASEAPAEAPASEQPTRGSSGQRPSGRRSSAEASPAERPVADGAAPAAEADLPADVKLRFSFRFQKWTEVLDWFAQQADLSLVMDNPPPGTFNYTDAREFTVSEALDLLNSVLLTKGYTLVRRNRMLLVLNTADGIPPDIVPRVTLEELDKRGSFELVTVTFPLGRRDPEAVQKEISHLLSPLGSVVLLPATRQLIVTERAGMMRAISAILQGISEPRDPEPKPKPPEPEKPTLTVYPIQNADPAKVQEVLQKLFSGVPFVSDSEARQVSAFATPSQHNGIKRMIDQIDANEPPDRAPRVEVYPISARLLSSSMRRRRPSESPYDGYPPRLVTQLQSLVPGMQLVLEYRERKLLAFGTPEDHAKLKETLEKLDAGDASADAPKQVEVYRMTRVDPASVQVFLENLFPGIDLTVDTASRSLIIAAPPADQLAIRNLIDQLQPAQPQADSPQLRVHPLRETAPSNLTTMLQSLAPAAQVTLAADGTRLLVLASPADHDLVQKTIAELEQAAAPEIRNTLKFYAVSPAQRTRFQAILTDLTTDLPGIRVITDAEPGELAIWAKPLQHTVLAQLLDELKHEVPEEQQYRLFAQPLNRATATKTIGVIQQLYPQLKVIQDTGGDRLLLWTTASQFADVQETLQQLEGQTTADQQQQFRSYEVRGVTPTAAIEQLQTVVPEARLSVDATTGKLIAWAMPADHDRLSKALAQLTTAITGTDQRQMEIFPLSKVEPTSTLTLLQSLLPEARLSLDTANGKLIALASPGDLVAVRALLEQLREGGKDPNAPVLEFYPLSEPLDAGTQAALAKIAPSAQITAEDDRLLVVASPEDHETIKRTLTETLTAIPVRQRSTLVIYPVTATQKKRVQAVLQSLTAELPGMQVISDEKPGELAVWAKPAQHEALRGILAQFTTEPSAEQQERLVAYTLQVVDAAKAQEMLTQLYPGAKITVDEDSNRLLIWTTSAEHGAIKESITEMDAGAPVDRKEKLMVYPLPNTDGTVALGLLKQLVPDATISFDTVAKTLSAWARPRDHQTIAEVVEQLQAGGELANASKVEIYPGPIENVDDALALLRSMVPTARLVVSAATGALAAFGTPRDQELVRSTLEQLKAQGAGAERTLRGFQLENMTAERAIPLLQSAVPGVTFAPRRDPQKLIAWGRADQLEKVAKIIEQLQAEGVYEKLILRSYTLRATTAPVLIPMLSRVIPAANITSGSDPREMIVWATDSDHQAIAQAVKELDANYDAGSLAIYQVKQLSGYAAAALISAAFPQVRANAGGDRNRILVWAKPDDHTLVQQLLDQIEKQGLQDDRVMTIYALKDADMTAVQKLLTPVLDTDTDVIPDTARKSLIVWAVPEKHAQIQKTLEQLLQELPEPIRPLTKVYHLEKGSASAAYYAASRLAPAATIALDSAGNNIVVTAAEEDHEVIAAAVEQLDTVGFEETTMQIYAVKSADLTNVYSVLQTLFPPQMRTSFTLNTRTRAIVAVAPAERHKEIERVIQQLEDQGAIDDRVLTVYPLDRDDATAFIKLLQPLLEQGVSYSQDERRNSLIVWATAEQHDKIRQTFQQLAIELPEPENLTTEVYHLQNATAYAVYTALPRLVPQAVIGLDTTGNNLVVTASAKDHEAIRAAVEQLDKAAATSAAEVKVYNLKSADPANVVTVLQSLLRQERTASFTADTRNQSVMAVAPAERQPFIQQVIEQLETAAAAGTSLTTEVYHLQYATAYAAYTALPRLVPQATIGLDVTGNNLVVTASAKDHEAIRTAVEQLDKAAATSEAEVKVYNLKSADPTNAVTVLQSLLRQERTASFTADTRNQSVMAVAPAERQPFIQQVIEQLETAAASGTSLTTEVYHLESATATAAYTALPRLVPQATIGLDVTGNNLVVTASAKDHEAIRAAVEQLDKAAATSSAEVKVYSLKSADPTNVVTMLQSLLRQERNATFTADTRRRSVLAAAPAEKQPFIQQVVEQLEAAAAEGSAVTTKVYRFKAASPYAAYLALTSLVPTARMGYDLTAKTLVVTASTEDHETVQAMVTEMDQAGIENQGIVQVYRLKSADPTSVVTALQTLFRLDSSVRVSVDERSRSIVAVAPLEQQKVVGEMIQQIEGAGPGIDALSTEVYHFKISTPIAAYRALTSLLPNVRLGYDLDGKNLVATATAEEHATIKALVDRMEQAAQEDQPTAQVYRLETADPTSVFTALQGLYRLDTSVRISLDARNRSVIAVASPEKQEFIKQTVEQMEGVDPAKAQWTTKVYRFRAGSPTAAYQALTALLPDAKMAYDTFGMNLVVTARPEDHDIVRQTVDEMDRAGLDTQGALQVYPLQQANPSDVLDVLQTIYRYARQIRISADTRSRAIVVVADAAEQKAIQETIEQLDAPPLNQEGWTTEVYHFRAASPTAARQTLEQLVPTARIVVDSVGMNLVVTAGPEDHARVKTTVDQMDQAGREQQGSMQVYPLKRANPNSVFEALRGLYQYDRETRVSLDARSGSIIAVAKPEQHESIATVIEQLEAGGPGQTGWRTQVYHLRRSDPRAAQQALESLLPAAEIAYDFRGRNLLVTASEDDHRTVQQVVDQMDQTTQETRRAPRIYRVENAELEDVYEVLQTLYRNDEETRISLDRGQQAIVAVARPEEQENIQGLIDDLEKNVEATGGADLAAYDLGEANGPAVLKMLQDLLAKETRNRTVQLTLLPSNNQIVAVARPKQQEAIRKALEQIQLDDRELEVFQLDVVDPFTAQMAIESLFGSATYGDFSAPYIESDAATQQLFIRGTPLQLQNIRDLLIKMGETQLGRSTGRVSSGSLRVVPFSGDARSAIDEIQRIWPQLRGNEIRVITPSEPLRSVRPEPLENRPAAPPPAPQQEKSQAAPQPTESSSVTGPRDAVVHSAAEHSDSPDESGAHVSWVFCSLLVEEQAATEDATPAESEGQAAAKDEVPAAPEAAVLEEPSPAASAAPSASQAPSPIVHTDASADSAPDPAQLPPVVVMPGDGSITLMSRDPEALSQLETLLAALARSNTGVGRNFLIVNLRNTSAIEVAETIDRLFRGIGTDFRSGRTGKVVAVPDERLNSIIVYANRSDQSIIESLVRVLDSAEVPESLALIRPTLIPIKNTRVSAIEQVLRDVYRTHLSTGGSRRQIELPRGMPGEVASVLRQISAANAAPLLTLGSDQLTNTLIIMAPADLAKEVSDLAVRLDDAALEENPAQRMRILTLKKLNASSLERSLDQVLRQRYQRRN